MPDQRQLGQHRGPAELEMLSTSYADDPELLVRMVAKAMAAPPQHPRIPLQAKLIAALTARQLRDREARRDVGRQGIEFVDQ
ncbi:hypothetical protein JHV675_54470 [Mycobacterium avium subsp. hominissuis]